MKTYEEKINAIIEYFENNEETFNDCIEELDSYNGYLGDDRYYYMEELDEFYCNTKPTEILYRAFYGHDEDYYTTDSDGDKHYEEFNPNRDYFRYNGYGNLVSADYKDYSANLDRYAIEEMKDNRDYIDSIEADDELSKLFDALEKDEEEELDEAFDEFCAIHDCDTCKFKDCRTVTDCFQGFKADLNAESEE